MTRLTITHATVIALAALALVSTAQATPPLYESTKIRITFVNRTYQDVALSYRKTNGDWKFLMSVEPGEESGISPPGLSTQKPSNYTNFGQLHHAMRRSIGAKFRSYPALEPGAEDIDFRVTAREHGERFAISESCGPEVVEVSRVRRLETQLLHGGVVYGRTCPPSYIGGPEYGRPHPHNHSGLGGYGVGNGGNPIQQWSNVASGIANLFK